jgi:hypothetical protein
MISKGGFSTSGGIKSHYGASFPMIAGFEDQSSHYIVFYDHLFQVLV